MFRSIIIGLLLCSGAFAQTQISYPRQVKDKPISSGSVLPTSCAPTTSQPTPIGNLFYLTTTRTLYVCNGTTYGLAAGTFNVLSFGATGDGTTDDTQAFQGAYAAAIAAGGGNIFMPCTPASYHIAGTLTVASPKISLTGENISCTKISHPEGGRPLIWQMNPFTIVPAGTFSNFTIIGSATGSEGILGGQSVGATYGNINVSGFTGSGAAGIRLHNSGVAGTNWTEQNSFLNVGVGGADGGLYNSNGILMDADDSDSSFGHNYFINIHANVSTGQVGLNLQSGYFYDSRVILDCNVDNALTGSTAGLCYRSNGNWTSNFIQIQGEFQTRGPGMGTMYSGQIESTARFSNLRGSNINILGPGSVVLPWNNLTSPTNSPNVTLVEGSAITSGDTGTFSLNGTPTTPQPIQRGNCSSLGLLIGTSTETPYLSLCGAPFVIGSSNGTVPIGSMATQFSFDPTGDEAMTGKLFVGWPGLDLTGVDPNAIADVNGKLVVRGAQNHYDAGIGSALSVGGLTVTGMAGYSNIGLTTTNGYNESIVFDGNSDASFGAVKNANVAHPFTSCYIVDPTCFEWHTKTMNTPVSGGDLIASLDSSGNFQSNSYTGKYFFATGGVPAMPPGQGGYLSWNWLGTGETDFLNKRGIGTGGWRWCDSASGTPICVGQLGADGTLTISGPVKATAVASTITDPNDNFGTLHFSASTVTNIYTMTGTWSNVVCVVTPVVANSLGSISIVKNLVSGHWQINAQAASPQTADANYYCGLVQ